jgi:hypothetical protein
VKTKEEIKASSKIRQRRYRLAHPERKEKLKAYNKQYGKIRYAKNKEAMLRRNKEYREKNKDKLSVKAKAYYERTKERDKSKRKQWRLNNHERLLEIGKKYRGIGREKRKEYDKHYSVEYRNTPRGAVTRRLRERIRSTLKGLTKSRHLYDLCGCDRAHLITHMEKQFTKGMSWEIFLTGEIHIDHKVPCAAFDFNKKEDQQACFHYTNLQPLWAKDNLSKRAFYTDEQKSTLYSVVRASRSPKGDSYTPSGLGLYSICGQPGIKITNLATPLGRQFQQKP